MSKNICILGSNGMLGHSLVKRLETENTFELLLPKRTEVDLLDISQVRAYFKANKIDTVLFLAAKVGGLQANISAPADFYIENSIIANNVISTAFEFRVPELINIGSSCMYPRDREELFEKDLLSGELEPTSQAYALAKLGAAFYCQYINQQYGLNYKTLIPCNLYGPYDNFDSETSHMLAAAIRKIIEAKETGRDVQIWGDGTPMREFLYVDDLSDCIVLALNNLMEMPQMVNVGLGYGFTINEYYQSLAEAIGFKGNFAHDLTRPNGVKKKIMNIDLAKNLGWKARTSLHEGIAKTCSYYLSVEKTE